MTQRALVQSTIQTVALTGQTEFTVPFEYLTRRYVVVTLRGPARKVLTLGTDYRFVSPTVISLFQSPGAEFTYLELRRITSATERLVNFMDGSILRAYDLNLSQIQTIHVAEEARDSVTVDSLGIDANFNLDARNKRIVNLADGIDTTDAVTLGQVVDIVSSQAVIDDYHFKQSILQYTDGISYGVEANGGLPTLRIGGMLFRPMFTQLPTSISLSDPLYAPNGVVSFTAGGSTYLFINSLAKIPTKSELSDVSLTEFGAVGDGAYDCTRNVLTWLAYLRATGARGFVPAGKYLVEYINVRDHIGLTITGAGWSNTEFIRKDTSPDSAVMRVTSCLGAKLTRFKINGQNSVSPNGSGLVLTDCGNSLVEEVWADDCGSLGILAIHPNGPSDDLSYLVSNTHIRRCIASNTDSGGIQMTGHKHSGISQSYVQNVRTTGIYFKCPVASVYLDDNSVVDANIGFSIGSDYGQTQRAIRVRMSNLAAAGVVTAARFGNMEKSIVANIVGVLLGVNTDGIGDGIRLENCMNNHITGVSVERVGDFRAAARFVQGCVNNRVEISFADVSPRNAYLAGFSDDSTDNYVVGLNPLGDVQAKRVDGNVTTNTLTERRSFAVEFTGQTVVNCIHNLKWSDIPVSKASVVLSEPAPSMPALKVISPNTFTVSFSAPYTGIVTVTLPS